MKKYYGKYRGTVINNVDPEQIGRIQAIVPDVSKAWPKGFAPLALSVSIFSRRSAMS